MRQLYFGDVSVRSLSERIIEGRALSFEVESNILCEDDIYFTETIKRGAITQELLDHSNVVLNFNHKNDDILGRSRNGVGSLKLELKDDGLYFSTVAPNTRFGDECLERVQRGDVTECSFAFTVLDENTKWSPSDIEGVLHRDIYKIEGIFDCSIVINPAYPQTFVHARSLELKNAKETMIEQKEKEEEVEERAVQDPKEEEEKEEQVEETSTEETQKEDEKTETDSETDKLNEDNSEEEPKPEEEEEEPKKEEKRNLNNTHKFMKKNVTLVQLIRSAMDNNSKRFNVELEERAYTGSKTMTQNQKTAPEGSDADPYYTEDTTVQEEFQSLMEPLYNNQVIKNMGIKIMTGAPKGDIIVPLIDKGTVGWASEIATAVQSGNTTSNVKLSPKRICAYVDISRQMLLTDTIGVNEAIRRDLYNAIADAVQNAMLDDAAATSDRPAGLLNGLSSTAITNFQGLCTLEANLQDAHFDNVQYLCSNQAYAKLRCLPKSSKTNELTITDGTIDGTPVTRTGALSGSQILLGDFSQVVMGVWQDAEVVVDEVSHAAEGFVRLVVNMYVDFKPAREGAFALATIG